MTLWCYALDGLYLPLHPLNLSIKHTPYTIQIQSECKSSQV